ncbi:hypothetical protein [Bacillus sp. 166amftsu]|uniref:hypothetical protein n=1 Tax=Bacillus sp. 166amftsu TaxID=1761753 RepID=UPI0008944A63|nr:hypothetical protein [Bacillus sp. 166amftsu]SDZ40472.1 hypothetical protein SAMN04488156_12812 [Bacillus sp. 166amftsu]
MANTLNGGVKWKFPDTNGFCERNLDCKQLSIKEILTLKGEENLIRMFLNSFDCFSNDLLLRRKEPVLKNGWKLRKIKCTSLNSFKNTIEETYIQNGYALIYFNSLNVPFSNYYKIHDVVHWALVLETNDSYVKILDDTGKKEYFQNNLGVLPVDTFYESFKSSDILGVSYLEQLSEKQSWEQQFENLLRESIDNMFEQGGIENLNRFVKSVRETSKDILVNSLEQLEFDINYYRKLRELWKVAVIQKAVPEPFIQSEWIEELWTVCNLWSLIMGILMKWKRQKQKDYREKLNYYLEKVAIHENKIFCNFKELV